MIGMYLKHWSYCPTAIHQGNKDNALLTVCHLIRNNVILVCMWCCECDMCVYEHSERDGRGLEKERCYVWLSGRKDT